MASVRPDPDLLLARRAAAGHADAWDELVDRYGRRIFNLAFQFTGRHAEAEDLTQEIFLRLYQNLGRYRGDIPLTPWALRLSRNLCIDRYRRSRRKKRSGTVSSEVLKHLPSDDDPQADAQRRERLRVVYRALEEIPEELALVIVLRDLQGLTYDETAGALDLPMGTVKSRLHRGRQELADRVRELLRPGPAPAVAPVLGAEPC